MGILEKIADIEKEIARTQKNKATEYHLGLLKAKLARYRQELLDIKTGSGGPSGGPSFEVTKSGDARVALIGFPSVGKSTLLSKMTSTSSVCAAYEFTTLTCIPGNIEYAEGGTVQLLDLPGIIQGACEGKGRGRQVIATARTADCILMMIDATKSLEQRELLTTELETMGLRLNRQPPNIHLNRNLDRGGVSVTFTKPQRAGLTEGMVQHILKEYKIHNAEVIVREEDASVDDFIDVVTGSSVVYVPCLYVYNKIDQLTMEEVERLSRQPMSLPISCELSLNLDVLKHVLWQTCRLVRVYTKKPGNMPDLSDPVILRHTRPTFDLVLGDDDDAEAEEGDMNADDSEEDITELHANSATVRQLCNRLHKDLASITKYALVWGRSVRHAGQRVGLAHALVEGDVVQICKQ